MEEDGIGMISARKWTCDIYMSMTKQMEWEIQAYHENNKKIHYLWVN